MVMQSINPATEEVIETYDEFTPAPGGRGAAAAHDA